MVDAVINIFRSADTLAVFRFQDQRSASAIHIRVRSSAPRQSKTKNPSPFFQALALPARCRFWLGAEALQLLGGSECSPSLLSRCGWAMGIAGFVVVISDSHQRQRWLLLEMLRSNPVTESRDLVSTKTAVLNHANLSQSANSIFSI